jgi:hypothetical protein
MKGKWVPTPKEARQRRITHLVKQDNAAKAKQEKVVEQKANPRKPKDKLNNRRR